MKHFLATCLVPALIAAATAAPAPRTITIDLGAPAKPISTDLFGIFYEDLNYRVRRE